MHVMYETTLHVYMHNSQTILCRIRNKSHKTNRLQMEIPWMDLQQELKKWLKTEHTHGSGNKNIEKETVNGIITIHKSHLSVANFLMILMCEDDLKIEESVHVLDCIVETKQKDPIKSTNERRLSVSSHSSCIDKFKFHERHLSASRQDRSNEKSKSQERHRNASSQSAHIESDATPCSTQEAIDESEEEQSQPEHFRRIRDKLKSKSHRDSKEDSLTSQQRDNKDKHTFGKDRETASQPKHNVPSKDREKRIDVKLQSRSTTSNEKDFESGEHKHSHKDNNKGSSSRSNDEPMQCQSTTSKNSSEQDYKCREHKSSRKDRENSRQRTDSPLRSNGRLHHIGRRREESKDSRGKRSNSVSASYSQHSHKSRQHEEKKTHSSVTKDIKLHSYKDHKTGEHKSRDTNISCHRKLELMKPEEKEKIEPGINGDRGVRRSGRSPVKPKRLIEEINIRLKQIAEQPLQPGTPESSRKKRKFAGNEQKGNSDTKSSNKDVSQSKAPTTSRDNIMKTDNKAICSDILTKAEVEEMRRENALQKERNAQMKQCLKMIDSPIPEEVKRLCLNDLSFKDIIDTLHKYEKDLDDIYERNRKQDFVKENNGVNHCLVINLLDKMVQLKMMEALMEKYNNPNCTKHVTLFANAIMPEWIIRIFMDRYELSREQAIKHIKDQEAYKTYMDNQDDCSLLMDD